MNRTLRGCIGLATLAGCAWAVGASAVQAGDVSPGTIEKNRVLEQERFVNMLLGRERHVIDHQLSLIAKQDSYVARQEAVARIVPSTPAEAQIQQLRLQHIGQAIEQVNNALVPGNIQLSALLAQTQAALNQLEQLMPVHPHVAAHLLAFEQLANHRFAHQGRVAGEIIIRPPASPFIPIQAADVLNLAGPNLAPVQAHSFRPQGRVVPPRPEALRSTARSNRRR